MSNKYTAYGLHPLIAAASAGHTSIVELLLKKSSGIIIILLSLCYYHYIVIIILLLFIYYHYIIIIISLSLYYHHYCYHKGIDINVSDEDGTNSLMAAALSGHKDMVKLLISKSINVRAQNIDGHNALMFVYNGKHQLLHLQEKYKDYTKHEDIETNNLLKSAIKAQINIISELIKAGVDPNQKDNDGHISSDFDI